MRCNVGVDPAFLADQHLCELAELKMVPGTLVRIGLVPKSPVPNKFKLSKGHIAFFYNKLGYLKKRHAAVQQECVKRGRKGSNFFYSDEGILEKFWGDWTPTLEDTMIVRQRICEKLVAKPKYWRYYGKLIDNIQDFAAKLLNSPLYKY